MLRLVVHLHPTVPCTDALVAELRALGMVVGRVTHGLGIIAGTAPADVVAAIRARADVAEVADETRLWDRATFR